MTIRPGIIGYVPPPSFTGAKSFLANLAMFKRTHELLLYSEHPYPECQVKLKGSPEWVEDAKSHKFAISNALFITGMKIAVVHGLTHVIYLESDCRVGIDDWDSIMFEEFFGLPVPVVASGSLVCWNTSNAGLDVQRRWQELLMMNPRRNFPIPTYGLPLRHAGGTPAIFPNGALGIYDLNWVTKLFDVNNTLECVKAHAWDFQLGEKIWNIFGVDSFDMVAHSNKIFSSYANEITTEQERLAMLRNKEVVAIHQVKSEITI